MLAYLFTRRDLPTNSTFERLKRELPGYQVDTKELDLDSVEGMRLASLYDLMEAPAVVLTRLDGSMVQVWPADQLPMPEEVSYLAHS